MIYFVSGNKGGVGKSFVTKALIHYILDGDAPVKVGVIDCDLSNMDIHRSCIATKGGADTPKPNIILPLNEDGSSMVFDLSTREGWIDLVEWHDQHLAENVVINTPATAGIGMIRFGHTINEDVLHDIRQQVTMLWVISRDRDCIDALARHIEAFPHQKIVVCKNGVFGQEVDFQRWDLAKNTKTKILKAGGNEIYISDLDRRLADRLVNNRLLFSELLEGPGLGSGFKHHLNEWKKNNTDGFQKIFVE
jgi:hypothetical protein